MFARERAPWFLGALLLVSACLNLHLWRSRDTRDADAPSPSQKAIPGTGLAGTAGPSPATTPGPGAVSGHAARAPAPSGGEALALACPAQLTDLAHRLTGAEKALEQHLTAGERFDRATAAPALERKLEAELQPLFADAPEGWSHDLECRGDVCRLEIVERDGGAPFDWMLRIQSKNRPKQSEGIGFAVGAPSQDPATGEPLQTHTVEIDMADESAVSGLDVLGEILARFRASGAIARCEAEHPAEGYWSVRLTLAREHPTVQVAAGGTLAREPVGSCLGAAMNEAIAATPVPQTFIGGVRFDTVNLPGP